MITLLLITPASAISGGAGPGSLIITSQLLSDQEVTVKEASITMYNSGNEPLIAHFELEGDISNPAVMNVEFEDNQPIIQPGEDKRCKITFTMKTRGTFEGILNTYLDNLPDETEEISGAGATMGIGTMTKVKVIVKGEAPKGQVKSIVVNNVEINRPLRILTMFENKGKVTAQPVISVDVFKGRELIGSSKNTEAIVQVGETKTIVLEWNTTGQGTGDYRAFVCVILGEETLEEEELDFSIKESGSLSKEGELIKITFQGQPSSGEMLKVLASFKNTGESDLVAEFVGEIYKDGSMLNVVRSSPAVIASGEQQDIASYATLEDPGDYKITGYINYEGYKTEEKSNSFSVTKGKSGAGGIPVLPLTQPSLLIGGLFVILVINLRRKRA